MACNGFQYRFELIAGSGLLVCASAILFWMIRPLEIPMRERSASSASTRLPKVSRSTCRLAALRQYINANVIMSAEKNAVNVMATISSGTVKPRSCAFGLGIIVGQFHYGL